MQVPHAVKAGMESLEESQKKIPQNWQHYNTLAMAPGSEPYKDDMYMYVRNKHSNYV